MKVRWIAFIMFVLIINIRSELCVTSTHKSVPSRAVWLTEVELPLNSRIFTNFLTVSKCPTPLNAWGLQDIKDFDGKYVAVTNIARNTEVTLENLSPLPHLVAPTNWVTLFYSSQDLLVAMPEGCLNSGAKVSIFDDKGNTYGPYGVEAILGKSEAPVLAVLVTNSDADIVSKLTKPKLRVVSLQ